MKRVLMGAGFAGMILLQINMSQAQYKGLGVESVSPETLKKYAPPSLDPIMANKLKKMFDVSSPGMGQISPDKKTLFFNWRVTGVSQVWKINGPKNFPTQLTSGQDEVTLNEVSPDGAFLIVSKDTNGQENPGIFKLDLKTGLMEELYRRPKVKATYAFITDDSQAIYFTSNEKSADSYSVYKLNLKDKSIETIFEGTGAWYVADQKENGKKILLTKYNGSMQNEYFDYDTTTKELTSVIGQGEKEDYSVTYAERAKEYFVTSNKVTDFKRLYLLAEGRLKPISPKLNYDISDFSIDENRTRLIYSINREGYTDIGILDAKTLKPIPLPKWPMDKNTKVEHILSGKTTRDGRMTMFGLSTPQAPRISYSYDWKTQKFTQWVLPSAPEVNLQDFVAAELKYYETRDQVKIPMFVRFPPQCRLELKTRAACPVVVRFHGGPEAQSPPGFSTVSQAFVEEGIILVDPNVRGSDGYGKKWVNLDNGPLRENVVTDIEDAALWIKEHWKNPDGSSPKLGAMGWSYGGYSTLMAMTRFAGAYEAGVALVGMSNLISFLNNTAPYRRALRISEYGDPEKDKDALIKLSPITYINRVKSPLMIVQGANDPRVPVGEALQIQETLAKKKIPSQLIVFADEGHGSAKKENQVLEIGHTIEFFKKHLK